MNISNDIIMIMKKGIRGDNSAPTLKQVRHTLKETLEWHKKQQGDYEKE